MSYKDKINQLKDEFSKSSSKLRIADAEGRHTDTCTKCTVKPIDKEYLCKECYIQHNAELTLFVIDKKFGKLSWTLLRGLSYYLNQLHTLLYRGLC